ncbi:MAG TPA: hypothetical protein VL688_02325 [Verrucomicrobiae bacterium]|jgi:hypothetical protein|nr:hypothetical protein [Verrucomicrobiae bacterium]
MEPKLDFKAQAQKMLSTVYDDQEHGALLELMRQNNPGLAGISKDQFALEYLPVKLALAARAWDALCQEAGADDAVTRKLFFQAVMANFQTPKMTGLAASFSDYFYAPDDAEEESVSAVLAGRLIQRLVPAPASASGRQAALAALSRSILVLVETLEAFRNSFEDEFHDFILSGFGS